MKNSDQIKSSTLVLTVLLLALGALSVVGQLYLPLPLLNTLKESYPDMVYPETMLISLFGLMYATGFLFFGPLSDHIGRKRVILWGILTLLLISLWVAWADNAISLLTARMIQGFFAASFPPAALAYISASLPVRYKSLSVSAMAFSFLSAVALAQVFVLMLPAHDFRLPESILAVFYGFLGLGLCLLLEKDPPHTSRQSVSFLRIFKSLPSILFEHRLRKYYAVSFTVLLVFVGFYLVLMSVMNMEKITFSALALRLWTLPFFLSCFMAAKTASFLGHYKALTGSFLLSFIALSIALIAHYLHIFPLMIIALCLLSAGVALMVPLLISAVSTHSEENFRGSAVALYTFVLFCGASTAPSLMTWLISHFDTITAIAVLTSIPLTCLIILLPHPK